MTYLEELLRDGIVSLESDYNGTRYKCLCGSSLAKNSIPGHVKTIRHKNFMSSLNQGENFDEEKYPEGQNVSNQELSIVPGFLQSFALRAMRERFEIGRAQRSQATLERRARIEREEQRYVDYRDEPQEEEKTYQNQSVNIHQEVLANNNHEERKYHEEKLTKPELIITSVTGSKFTGFLGVQGDSDCPICYDDYKDGRFIKCPQCIHIICLKCRQKLNPGICPFCKHEYRKERPICRGESKHNMEKLIKAMNFMNIDDIQYSLKWI